MLNNLTHHAVSAELKNESVLIGMKGITKRFGSVQANYNVDFDLKEGEIHALLGENGAGKTTLMNILYGLYKQDKGEIYFKGNKVNIASPRDAIDLGIGMVHQHFMLLNPFSVIENIILGLRSGKEPFLDTSAAKEKLHELSKLFGVKVDPDKKIWQLSVGEKQRIEILKAIYRGCKVLILDEPTAVLTPSEVIEISKILEDMVTQKIVSIIFITHKLPEVMALSHRVTVMRNGRVVMNVETKDTSPKKLAKAMVDIDLAPKHIHEKTEKRQPVLEVNNLTVYDDKGLSAVKNISFSVSAGEIFAIAGVSGNGQRELVEAIVGLRKIKSGEIKFFGKNITNLSVRKRIDLRISHIPEDRLETGLIPGLSIVENCIVKIHDKQKMTMDSKFPKKLFINFDRAAEMTKKLIQDYNVSTPAVDIPVRNLSGGNLQKLLLARELSADPLLLIAQQPTRGLDVKATEYIQKQLLNLKNEGVAILLDSVELEEVMALGDVIAVMYEGQIVGQINSDDAKIKEIGLLMSGIKT